MAGANGMGQGEFRRMVAISAVLHAGALGLAVAAPERQASVTPLPVIAVELVALPSTRPKATPAPPAPRAKPKPKQIVLPKTPSLPKPKPKPKVERRREVVLEPEVKEEKSLEDLLAEMRKESGEAPPTPEPEVAAVAPSQPAVGRVVPKEVLVWNRQAKIRLRENWILQAGFRMQDLQTHVEVTLDAQGDVIGEPRKLRGSGNPYYDDSVMRAFAKTRSFPPPPEPGKQVFIMTPEDSY
jgi:TonB family protein